MHKLLIEQLVGKQVGCLSYETHSFNRIEVEGLKTTAARKTSSSSQDVSSTCKATSFPEHCRTRDLVSHGHFVFYREYFDLRRCLQKPTTSHIY